MAILCPHQSFAQGQLGGYLTLGIQTNTANHSAVLALPVGAFYDRTIHKFTAGVDIHNLGAGDVSGYGVGPRFTFPLRPARPIIPYAELLFGSANATLFNTVLGSTTFTYQSGALVGSAFGVDIMANRYFGSRFNFEYGHVAGGVNANYSAFSFGIIARFKTP